MQEIRNSLPKEELISIINVDSISHPIAEFPAQKKELLIKLAKKHLELKNKIIAEIQSLYPEDEWDFLKPIRDQFFGGREKDREKTCKALSKGNFQLKKKAFRWARELRHRIQHWNWKEES